MPVYEEAHIYIGDVANRDKHFVHATRAITVTMIFSKFERTFSFDQWRSKVLQSRIPKL